MILRIYDNYSGTVTKTDVIISGVHRRKRSLFVFDIKMTLFFALEASFSKRIAGHVPFRAFIGTGKEEFFEAFSPKFDIHFVLCQQTCFFLFFFFIYI